MRAQSRAQSPTSTSGPTAGGDLAAAGWEARLAAAPTVAVRAAMQRSAALERGDLLYECAFKRTLRPIDRMRLSKKGEGFHVSTGNAPLASQASLNGVRPRLSTSAWSTSELDSVLLLVLALN